MRVCAFLLILLSAGAATASAQSLADVAKQESDRRKTMTGAGKTYSDKDLKPVPPAPVQPDAAATGDKPAGGSASAADAAAPDKAGADAKTPAPSAKDDKSAVKDEAYWSKRMAALREQLDRDETYLSAIQNRIDSLTTDFVNRDDPAQRGQIASDRDKALAELERLRKAVEEDRRAIPALEEEARREGVPAGWLR
jgi:hypothetical protein